MIAEKAEDVVNIGTGSQQQVNVMSMDDDDFSTDEEHVSSLMYNNCQPMLIILCKYDVPYPLQYFNLSNNSDMIFWLKWNNFFVFNNLDSNF